MRIEIYAKSPSVFRVSTAVASTEGKRTGLPFSENTPNSRGIREIGNTDRYFDRPLSGVHQKWRKRIEIEVRFANRKPYPGYLGL